MIDNELLPTEGPGRKDMLELYSWDLETACRVQNEWEDNNGAGRGPLFRWIGAEELKGLYETYKEKKNPALIIEVLHICSLNSLPLPRWCEMGFLKAYRKVRQYRAKSWDDVFGRPHKKGTHLETKRQEREKPHLVYRRIEEIRKNEPLTAIDGDLFERVGKELGIGAKTLTESYYYKELKFRKPHQCRRCEKRFAYWHEINKDGLCHSCEDKERAHNKNGQ